MTQKIVKLNQRTIKQSIHFQGIGLFSGNNCNLRLIPQESHFGIVFERTDLKEQVPLSVDYLDEKNINCTGLIKNDVKIQTIEHLLSALYAFQITNVLIQIDAQEIPIFDGSAQVFVDAIEKCGIEDQGLLQEVVQIKSPLYFTRNDVTLIALPYDRLKISYTFSYPKSKRFAAQFLSLDITQETFKKELAFSRTFAFYDDIAPLIEMGLVKGADFERGLLIKEDEVQNNQLHREDELVRHKILDLIGDLSLIGKPLFGHIVAIRSGHKTNATLAKQIKECEGVNV
jgi:UDP-3-O-[3-hydroxymyristoyl] N-acetylglucosamine deacetylase